MSDTIFSVNSSSFNDVTINNNLIATVNSTIDLSAANYVSGTFTGIGSGLTNITASYITITTTASISNTSSYLNPGATLYVVSGSDGIAPAYLEPYDYSLDNVYRPLPIKEGRTMWDHKWVDWSVYDDSGARTHLGREVCFAVHNPTNQTLPRMSAVYISGSQTASLSPHWGDPYKPDVYLSIADGTNTKTGVIGLVRQAILPHSDGYVLQTGTMHNSDVSSFGTVGTQLWLSPTVEGGLTATKPGQPNEVVSCAYVIEAGTVGSLLVQTRPEPPPANAYAGMTSLPTFFDDTSSLEFCVGAASVNLYKNVDGIGAITQFPLLPVTYSVPTATSASFIYATTNGLTASYQITSNFNDINGTTKVPVVTIYRADQDVHWLACEKQGLALANKLELRLIETEKFAWESGFTLYETGSRQFFITAGEIWFGATNISQGDFDSRLTESVSLPVNYSETHFAQHSAGEWTIPIVTDGTYNNKYYDNGTNLIPLSTGYYTVNYMFRILGDNLTDIDTFYLASNNQYADLASAQTDTIPASIPGVLSDVSLLVGRIIVLSGSNTAAAVESAFTTNFGQSLVSQHNNLAGLQGGLGGQFYHISSADYTGNGTGTMVRTDNASLTNTHLTGALLGTSSWAITASYVGAATFITTAQTASYVILTQTASYVATASYVGAATYITTAQTASYVATASYVGATTYITTAQTASYISASNIDGTVQSSLISISASFASSSISASFSTTSETANAISFIPLTTTSASWVSASVLINSASYANTSSWAINTINGGTQLFTGSTYTITASWSVSASWAPNVEPISVLSASWVSASVKITTADTASYILASNVNGTVSNAIQSLYATNSLMSVSSSFASESISASYATNANVAYSINFTPLSAESASWASSSISSSYSLTSSYASNVISVVDFSRGGVFFDVGGIAGTYATASSLVVWRAPFACNATQLCAYRVTGSTARVNAERNGSNLLTASYTIANTGSWNVLTALQNNSFSIGDTLEITLVSSSGYPTQVAIQIDMQRV